MLTVSKLRIDFSNGVIHTPLTGDDKRDLYNFVRSAFLDGVLPITKIVGFKLEDNASLSVGSLLDRCQNILDNNLEISSKLESLCFVGSSGSTIVEVEGSLSSEDIQNSMLPDDLELISEHIDILTENRVEDEPLTELNGLLADYSSDNRILLKLIFRQSSGFHNMTDNLTYMIKEFNDKEDIFGDRMIISEFMPINSNHSLSKHIRFLPFIDDKEDIKFVSKLNENLLNKLWNSFLDTLIEKGVEE